MAPYNGFDHNAQTLRILTMLERRHAEFDGLNLTWETLEGAVKHNGPLAHDGARPLPAAIVEYAASHDLWLDTRASLEAQCAAIADDIAYNNHDVDDGLRAGLFSFEDVRDLPLIGESLTRVLSLYPTAPWMIQVAEAVSDLIGVMVEDVVLETRARLEEHNPRSADEVRRAGRQIVDFSPEMHIRLKGLRGFLKESFYRHYKVNRARSQAKRIVRALFDVFMNEPETLPPEWAASLKGRDEAGRARVVCDYIAGMTDRFAMREHEKLFGSGAMNPIL